MAISLKEIQAPIAEEMRTFERKFRDSVKTSVPIVNRIMLYIVKRKGKQIRPMLVFLSAGTCGPINDKTHRGAALVELLHTATLLHDDVVDGSMERRGFFSVYALWKSKVAILVGDFLLAKGLLLSVGNKDYDMLEISSEAVRLMSEGELFQLEKTRTLNLTEEQYYEVIRMKTASLIATCCAMGARSVSDNNGQVEKMRLFGEKVGIAFQIKDDLFDYGDNAAGKPSGIDIKEKKLTLPLIHAMNQVSRGERRQIIRTVKGYDADRKKFRYLVDFVVQNGGIAYAEQAMRRYTDEAMKILHSFPESAHREALGKLVEYTIRRNQ